MANRPSARDCASGVLPASRYPLSASSVCRLHPDTCLIGYHDAQVDTETPAVSPSPDTAIERFVRQTLGCQCPDEVFRSITVDAGTAPAAEVSFTRLAIGDRLLIYIVESQPGAQIADAVVELARLGRAERDERGYNRFRLVIAAAEPKQLAEAAATRFAARSGADERAHLHVVAATDLPRSVRQF